MRRDLTVNSGNPDITTTSSARQKQPMPLPGTSGWILFEKVSAWLRRTTPYPVPWRLIGGTAARLRLCGRLPGNLLRAFVALFVAVFVAPPFRAASLLFFGFRVCSGVRRSNAGLKPGATFRLSAVLAALFVALFVAPPFRAASFLFFLRFSVLQWG